MSCYLGSSGDALFIVASQEVQIELRKKQITAFYQGSATGSGHDNVIQVFDDKIESVTKSSSEANKLCQSLFGHINVPCQLENCNADFKMSASLYLEILQNESANKTE